MSRCAWCKDVCGKGESDSHGVCIHCQAKVSPNSPRAKRYALAMERGRQKMLASGLLSAAYLNEINKWEISK